MEFKELDRLNKLIADAQHDPELMKSYAPAYFAELRQHLPVIMASIIGESNKDSCTELLQRIFQAQYQLMPLNLTAHVSIDSDLWEIAEDFDNDDPNAYDYLIQKIKNKEYLIQN